LWNKQRKYSPSKYRYFNASSLMRKLNVIMKFIYKVGAPELGGAYYGQRAIGLNALSSSH